MATINHTQATSTSTRAQRTGVLVPKLHVLRAGANRPTLQRARATGPLDSEQHAKLTPQLMVQEAKWEAGFRDGTVRNVSPKDAGALLQDGWVLLDVRPPNEVKKARLANAVEVPMFMPDTATDLGSLLKQMSAFGMGGWWLGGAHMVPNANFLAEVQAKIPKDRKIIVGCQKGLRSLGACEQLSRAGYPALAWISGGFDSSKGELPTEGNVDIRVAGIGGLSEVLGWTEVQQETSKGVGGGFMGIIKAAAVLLALDLALFAYEQVKYLQENQ